MFIHLRNKSEVNITLVRLKIHHSQHDYSAWFIYMALSQMSSYRCYYGVKLAKAGLYHFIIAPNLYVFFQKDISSSHINVFSDSSTFP